jgi:hypothetical protein
MWFPGLSLYLFSGAGCSAREGGRLGEATLPAALNTNEGLGYTLFALPPRPQRVA